MSKVRVEMFPAKEGDCFLISTYGKSKINILIDGGYKETYHNYLKPKLKEMHQKGEQIDLLIITHIDADHIEGIIELFKENGNSKKPNIISIKEVWHNSYKHLQFDMKENNKLDFREESILKEKIAKGQQRRKDKLFNQNKSISARDGSTLAGLLLAGNYNWNSSYEGNAINVDVKDTIFLTDQIKFRVLSPDSKKLKSLANIWIKELKKFKYDFKFNNDKIFDDAYEFFMLNSEFFNHNQESIEISNKVNKDEMKVFLSNETAKDYSPINGSSISFIIEFNEKRLLFLADSHSRIIEEKIQRLIAEDKYNTFFNLIKVSHHGSNKNTSVKLLELIDSFNYLFSTNGEKHNHPNPETIARIVSREGEKRNLIFNYDLKHKYFKNIKTQEKYNYTIDYPEKGKSIVLEF